MSFARISSMETRRLGWAAGSLGSPVTTPAEAVGLDSHLHLRKTTDWSLVGSRVPHRWLNVKFTNAKGLLYVQKLLAK